MASIMNKYVTIFTTYFLLLQLETDFCAASPLNMSWYHWLTPSNVEQEQLNRCMNKQGNVLLRLTDRKAYLDQLYTCIRSNLDELEKQKAQKKDPVIRASERYRMPKKQMVPTFLMSKMENSSDVPGARWPILLTVQIPLISYYYFLLLSQS